MVRQVQITIPMEMLEKVQGILKCIPDVHHLVCYSSMENEQCTLMFTSRTKKLQGILDHLDEVGCGRLWGFIHILSLQMTKPRLNKIHSKPKQYRIDDRMSIEEIYEAVDSQLHLTFDYLALSVVAAMISCAGLLSDSSIIVASSMLLSPLMGPILGQILGYLLKDYHFMKKGFINELVGVGITFSVGCVCALIMSLYGLVQTNEMISRGQPSSLIWGLFVAIPSGVGVALSISKGGINALVGVAISVSLLPPVVNCGIVCVFGIVSMARNNQEVAAEYGGYFLYSLCLFLINWIAIVVFGIITLKLKNIRYKSEGTTTYLNMKDDTFPISAQEYEMNMMNRS